MYWFQVGGPSMWLILLADFALLGLITISGVATLVTIFIKKGGLVAKILAGLTLMASFLPLLVGVAGWQYGLSQMNAALAYVDPSSVAMIEEAGRAEASVPLQFGGGSTLCLFVTSALVLFAAISFNRQTFSEDDL